MHKSERINRSILDKSGLFWLFGPLLTEAGAWGAATTAPTSLRPCVRKIQSPRYICDPLGNLPGIHNGENEWILPTSLPLRLKIKKRQTDSFKRHDWHETRLQTSDTQL